MTNEDEKLGRLGGEIITSAAAVTGANFYLIYVTDDSVFTVCKEKDFETDVAADVMAEQNLTGITVKAGTILAPRKKMFSDITMTSGQCYAYKGS